MADMTGKRVIVTGGTNGIGEVSALELAKMGAAVTVISRNADKLDTTVNTILAAGGEADYIQADLSSIADIRAAAEAYKSRHDRLDVLLNNAGAVFSERYESADGLELTLALNHISYFLLSNDLLDLLKQTAAEHGEARIINVSSEAHRSGVNWDDIQYQQRYQTFAVYAQSKALNILHANALARRLDGTHVTVNSLHPGLVNTGFANNTNLLFRAFGKVLKLFGKTPEDGAATSIYLASAPDVKGITGKYFADKAEKDPIPETMDEAKQERLWELSEQWTGIKTPAGV